MGICDCRKIVVGLIFVTLVPGFANAADLTLFVGGAKPGKLKKSGILTSLDGGPVFGARLGVNFVPALGVEGTLAFSSDYLFPRSFAEVTDTKGFVGSTNLIVSFPHKHVVPYLTAGAGLIYQYGSGNPPVGARFAVNYGGGLKLRKLVHSLGLRVDARGYTALGIFSRQLNILEVSGGLLISF